MDKTPMLPFGYACATIAFTLIVVLITREVWCWYLKLNAMLAELRAIRQLLEIQTQQQQAQQPASQWAPGTFK